MGIKNIQGELQVNGSKVITEATITGSSHNHDGVYATPTYADNVATAAAQQVKSDLLNGAGAAYDTLKELGGLIDENKDAIDALEEIAASKLPLSGGNLTGTLGIGIKYEIPPIYNYENGCLIEIGPSASSTMVAIHIVGNSYEDAPINSIFQFYDFGGGALIHYSGVNFGYELGNMIAYRHNGKLYAYIKQTRDYQTLSFTVLTNKTGLSPKVSNSAAHNAEECTDLITITPQNYYTAAEIDNKVNAKSAKTHTHTVTHKPAGTVSTPTITVTPNTTTVNSITAVGTLPALSHTDVGASKISSWSAGTLPSASLTGGGANLTATVSTGPNRCITLTHSHSNPTLTFSAGTLPSLSYTDVTASKVKSWSAGTLPTKGNDTTVVTSIKSATSTQPTFTGTEATLTTSAANS